MNLVPNSPQAAAIHVKEVQLLSDDWYILKKARFEHLRRDGTWQELTRETYDRGNGATMLLYNLELRSVILTRQFRYPAFVNGHPGMLIEAAAGLLDEVSPEDRIRAEVEEETGFHVSGVQRIFEAFMSPGSVTEKLYFFVAAYSHDGRANDGGETRLRVKTLRYWRCQSGTRLPPSRAASFRTERPSCCCSMPPSIFFRAKEVQDDISTPYGSDRWPLPLGDRR